MYNTLCTLGLVVGLYARYQLYLQWFQSRGLFNEFDNLMSTGWWKQLLIEIALVLIAPYPLLQEYRYEEYID